MTVHISEEELTLLAYLDEHATGYTPSDLLRRKQLAAINSDLNISGGELRKYATYLASFGLVGVDEVSFNNALAHSGAADIIGIGITGYGANYLRELEVEANKIEPGKFKKITVAAVKASAKILVPAATNLLTSFVGSHAHELAIAVGRMLSN
jgi:hypothetical protein